MQIVNGTNPDNSDRSSDEYICINSCGYYHITDRDVETSRPAGRSDYQILYLAEGKGLFKINGEFREVTSGELVLYRPFEPQFYRYNKENRAKIYWVHFTGKGIPELLTRCNLQNSSVFQIGNCVKISDLIFDMIHQLQLKQPQYELYAASCLMQLFISAARRLQMEGSLYHKQLLHIIEEMHEHYAADTSVEMYAEMCNLSKYHFIRLFRRYTGASPLAFKRNIRMEKAKHLLSDTTLTIAEISKIVGYSDPLYFSRAFKKHTGYPPSLYHSRKQSASAFMV